MSELKKLIVVLGAHRSGTSLCAAAVASLGADPCLGDIYANDENQKGFFEHPELVEFNDALLAHLGGSWDNPLFQAPSQSEVAEFGEWLDTAAQLLQKLYGEVPVALVKDPRMCQLLTFWQAAFARAGYSRDQVLYIHTLRSPVEVALSQRNRALANDTFYEYGKTLAEGAALWLSLTAQALESRVPAFYVAYHALLQEPANLLHKLAEYLQLPVDDALIEDFCSNFVDRGLYRAAGDEDARAELHADFSQVLEFDAALQPLLDNVSEEAVEPALAVYHRPDTRQRMVEIVTPAAVPAEQQLPQRPPRACSHSRRGQRSGAAACRAR